MAAAQSTPISALCLGGAQRVGTLPAPLNGLIQEADAHQTRPKASALYIGQLLIPALPSAFLHLSVAYVAALYAGLEMSNADLAAAEGSGDAPQLRLDFQRPEGICMAILRRETTRERCDSEQSEAALDSATPF